MDLQKEKNRLLNLIEVNNLYDDEIDIKLDNIDLNIEKSLNSGGHNLSIIYDINVNQFEIEKYDKSNSEIVVNYTIYDENFSSINMGSVNFYFDGGLFESEFTGNKTVLYEVQDLILENISEIDIETEAFLYEKNDADDKVEVVI